MRALRLFFGVRSLHLKLSPLVEMGDLLVRWLVRMQGVIFWGKVLIIRTYVRRMLNRTAAEAMRFGRGNWIGKMSTCCM